MTTDNTKLKTNVGSTLAVLSLIGVFFHAGLSQFVVHAAEFSPLSSSFTGLFGAASEATLSGVLTTIFTILIALGVIFAILRIALSGITYMLSESFTNKESAKKGLQGSVLGLLLLLSVVLILNQINSNLVDLAVLKNAPKKTDIAFTPQEVETSRFVFNEGSSNRVEFLREDIDLTNTDIRVYEDECSNAGGIAEMVPTDDSYILTCPL